MTVAEQERGAKFCAPPLAPSTLHSTAGIRDCHLLGWGENLPPIKTQRSPVGRHLLETSWVEASREASGLAAWSMFRELKSSCSDQNWWSERKSDGSWLQQSQAGVREATGSCLFVISISVELRWMWREWRDCGAPSQWCPALNIQSN